MYLNPSILMHVNVSIFRIKAICKQRDTKWEESALAWNYPGSGTACLYMAIEAVVYFLLVLLIEVCFTSSQLTFMLFFRVAIILDNTQTSSLSRFNAIVMRVCVRIDTTGGQV